MPHDDNAIFLPLRMGSGTFACTSLVIFVGNFRYNIIDSAGIANRKTSEFPDQLQHGHIKYLMSVMQH